MRARLHRRVVSGGRETEAVLHGLDRALPHGLGGPSRTLPTEGEVGADGGPGRHVEGIIVGAFRESGTGDLIVGHKPT